MTQWYLIGDGKRAHLALDVESHPATKELWTQCALSGLHRNAPPDAPKCKACLKREKEEAHVG